ncbi:nuclear transport factor 2 family protein [Allomuricauda sp. SCSIO 65647]|uniref:nuclear transport factor 2 family protein n=1 Tax=Allomuricauda sp. SCSIO 65647 TaxID=2908843 RepID=UPI001F2D9C59|nr:nuclear transport factor 2 family protein [Muricauda sp. SCSIO 65647]UJH67480.1 nuclear transport factor 2 family protein [Muricauda sp. SCSIO 65647]
MKRFSLLTISLIFLLTSNIKAQTRQDSLAIKQAALDYIEAQHNVRPDQFERSAHPRMVKRTFWKDKETNKEYLRETFTDAMVLLSETYNENGDGFPQNPKKEVVILDVFDKTASVKLIADEWIDYMHIVKLNGKWQIVNVLWQFNDSAQH